MKKFNIICCLLLFGYVQTGYFIQSFALRYAAKRNIIQLQFDSPADSPLEKFALDDLQGQIRWEEEGKEFWLNGQLYDIVGTVIIEGKTFSFCFNDLHEEDIITGYINNIGKRSHSGDQQKSFGFIFSLQYLFSGSPAISNFMVDVVQHFPSYTESILQRYGTIISPPPDPRFSYQLI